MKKYKWNKGKFAINILKLEGMTALAMLYAGIFLSYLVKQEDNLNSIKEFRKRKQLSQCDLAKLMNIKQNTISQWENDIRIPNVRQALRLLEILETTVESLYKQKILTIASI